MAHHTMEAGGLRRAAERVVVAVIGTVVAAFVISALGLLLFSFWPIFGESSGIPRTTFAVAKKFIKNRGNYMAGRHYRQLYAMAQQVKRVVPEGSKVFVSGKLGPQVRMRYYLLPELTMSWEAKNWDYYIDRNRSLTAPPAGSTQVLLESGNGVPPVALYSAPGKTFANQELAKDKADSTLRTLLWFAILQSLNLLGGCFLLLFLRGQSLGTIHGHLYSLALAYLLGFVWNNGIIMLLAAAGIPLSALLIIVCYISLPILLAFFVRRVDMLRLFTIPLGRVRETPRGVLVLTAVFGSLALALFFWVTVSSVLNPNFRWDAVSHWLPKARVIYGFDEFRFHQTHHNEYPILWPLSIAVHFFFTNYHADYVAHWLVGLFLIVMLIFLYHGARITRLGPAGSTAAIVGFFFFFYDDILLSAYAEGLFTLFFAASVVVLLDRLVLVEPRRCRDYVVVAMMFLGLTLAKFEGHIAVLIIGIAWTLVLPIANYSIRHYIYWIPTFLLCVVPQYAWISWQRCHGFLKGYSTQLGAGMPDGERIKVWLEGTINYFAEASAQNLIFFGVLAVLIVLGFRALLKRTEFQAMTMICVGMLAFSFVSLLGWQTKTIPSGFSTTVPRLYLHFTPALLLVCTMALAEVSRYLVNKNRYSKSEDLHVLGN